MTLAQQAERDDLNLEDDAEVVAEEESAPTPEAAEAKRKTPEDRKNATVIAIFDWMRDKGRVINIAKESLTEEYTDFPKPYEEPAEPDWSDDAAKNSSSTNADSLNDKAASDTHYEHDDFLAQEGEEVIAGGKEDDATAGAHEDGSDSESSFGVDDEVPAASGLGEGDWESAATSVQTQGCWQRNGGLVVVKVVAC